jgi:glycosyltransferase involved in cell wall biosynthesis
MRPLHWLVMATHVPEGGSPGGVVRYTSELIRALAQRPDVVVTALTTKAGTDTVLELMGPSGRVRTVSNAPVQILSVAERHASLPGLRRGQDVVHGVKHLLPTRSTALRVLTVHDMLLLDRPEDFGRAKRCLLPRSYLASIRVADLLLCVSEATRQRLSVQARDTESRSRVVHLATSSSLQSVRSRPIPTLVGRRFALVVGDSSPRKNLRTVMQAWMAVRRALPDAVLAVAGPPSWGETVVGALYGSLVAAGAVVPLGYLDDAELRWAYENAGVVLCPSLAEGFGLPAAEALDFGAPLVVSDDPALREVCAGRAQAVLPPTAADVWAGAIVDAFVAPVIHPPGRRRSWADVAQESVSAVHDALRARQALVGSA